MKRLSLYLLLIVVLSLAVGGCSVGQKSVELDEDRGWTPLNNNLHQVDGPPPGNPERAFRVYRSGAPSRSTFQNWCTVYGIERVIVMSGDAEAHELKYQGEGICQDIEVIYNIQQNHAEPVSDGFLEWFDAQVQRAEEDGVGLLFRCQTGSHRAGRTAAYYQMKYQGVPVDEAIEIMDHKGMLMPLFNPVLIPQVYALDDYIHGRPCSQEKKYCVEINSDKWLP